MLHDRPEPDPLIAAWLAHAWNRPGNTAGGPANMLTRWQDASPRLQSAILRPFASRLDVSDQLRYGTWTDSPRKPGTDDASVRAATVPTMFWRGWALRLAPPDIFAPLPYRASLSVLLLLAGAAGITYRQAQQALGQTPLTDSAKFSAFTGRLRNEGVLEPVMFAIAQLARALDDHGAPLDYARRRRLRRLACAQLDTADWRRRRFFLTHPDTWAWRRHLDRADLPAFPRQERFARLLLIELLTGTHPSFLPPPLRLSQRDAPDYAEFAFQLPKPLADCLHQQARRLLQHTGIDEPVCWEPPFDWATGITWPGPHPGWRPHRRGGWR